jgi:ribonuclease P protein component
MNKFYKILGRKNQQFLLDNKKSLSSPNFGLYHHFAPNPDSHFHYLLSISRKYGQANERNLIKRRIRAILTKNIDNFADNVQFMVVIRPTSRILSFQEIESELIRLFEKAKVLKYEE